MRVGECWWVLVCSVVLCCGCVVGVLLVCSVVVCCCGVLLSVVECLLSIMWCWVLLSCCVVVCCWVSLCFVAVWCWCVVLCSVVVCWWCALLCGGVVKCCCVLLCVVVCCCVLLCVVVLLLLCAVVKCCCVVVGVVWCCVVWCCVVVEQCSWVLLLCVGVGCCCWVLLLSVVECCWVLCLCVVCCCVLLLCVDECCCCVLEWCNVLCVGECCVVLVCVVVLCCWCLVQQIFWHRRLHVHQTASLTTAEVSTHAPRTAYSSRSATYQAATWWRASSPYCDHHPAHHLYRVPIPGKAGVWTVDSHAYGLDWHLQSATLTWQVQQQQRQPHLAPHSEFLAVFANQIAAAHVQNFPSSFFPEPVRLAQQLGWCLPCLLWLYVGLTAGQWTHADAQRAPLVRLATPLYRVVSTFLVSLSTCSISSQCFDLSSRFVRLCRSVSKFGNMHNSLCSRLDFVTFFLKVCHPNKKQMGGAIRLAIGQQIEKTSAQWAEGCSSTMGDSLDSGQEGRRRCRFRRGKVSCTLRCSATYQAATWWRTSSP